MLDISPQVWEAYVAEQFPRKGNVLASGLVAVDTAPVFQASDTTRRIPKLNHLDTTGDDVVLDGSDLYFEQIDNYAEYGIISRRSKVWGAKDLQNIIAGVDPLTQITAQISDYVANQIQKNLGRVTRSVYASSLASTHVNDITAVSSGTITAAGVIGAKGKVGENRDNLKQLLLHSKVLGDLEQAGLVNYVAASTFGDQLITSGSIPTFLGLRITTNDTFCAPLTAVLKPTMSGGAFSSIAVIDGGKGYAASSTTITVAISATAIVNGVRTAVGSGAVLTATSNASGVITSVAVTTAGSGYSGTGLVITLTPTISTPIYPSYLVGGQPWYVGYQRALNLEQQRDILVSGGISYLKASLHYVPHFNGVSWNSGTVNPSNFDLLTPGNWQRKQPDDSKILCVQLLTK